MIDIRFLRENPDVVKENIKKKFQDEKLPLVDEVIELDNERRSNQQEADELRANRNKISKEIGMLMGQGKKEEAEAKKAEVAINAETVGFKAGDVYQALATAGKALSVKEIAKAAKISDEETLLGMGWLFKEGKIKGENNLITLA